MNHHFRHKTIPTVLKPVLMTTLMTALITTLIACGGTGTPNPNPTPIISKDAPATPLNVGNYDPDGSLEDFPGDRIYLQWDANTETDMKGYTVYYGQDEKNLTEKKAVTLEGDAPTAQPEQPILKSQAATRTVIASITGLSTNKPYFFSIEAEDKDGNRSARTSLVTSTPKDSKPPKLLSSIPVDATIEVPVNLSEVKFEFDEAMNSTKSNIKCSGTYLGVEQCNLDLIATLGSPTWSADKKTVSFKPTQKFLAKTKYEITLYMEDLNGNMTRDYTAGGFSGYGWKITFTTGPKILMLGGQP
jgi:hypothetical protein